MNETHSNPFPGLRPFKTKETHLFFGRGNQVSHLVQRLRNTHFLAIVGASGCGKSSLIRAGLLPSLQAKENSPLLRENSPVSMYRDMIDGENVAWRMVTMRPGDSPTSALALALSKQGKVDDHWEEGQRDVYTNIVETTLRSSSMGLVKTIREARLPAEARILILVDQFEELFRFWSHCKDNSSGDEAQAFVRLLLNGVRDPSVPIYIILTMRSDYLGNCMVFPGLPEAISESQYLVPRMSRNELLKSITGPLATAQEKIAPRLASHLLNELGEDQDQLPILQHFLMRLWDRWVENRQDKTPLDFQHLQEEDSIQKALGRHADQIYEELKEENKHNIVKKIFKILTETNSEGLGIRRPASLQLLCDITGESKEDIIAVIEKFRAPGRSFLMPPAGTDLSQDTIIDISHESLMRTWGRLGDWIAEEENSARYYRRYLDAAKGWHEKKDGDKRKVYLWTDINDDRLDFALLWQKKYHPSAAWATLYTPDRDRDQASENYALVDSFIMQSKQGREKELKRIVLEKRKKRKKKFFIAVGGLCSLIFLVSIVLINFHYAEIKKQKLAHAIIDRVKEVEDPLIQALVLLEQKSNVSNAEDLLRNISTEIIPQAIYSILQEDIVKVAIHPDDKKIAVGTSRGSVYLINRQLSTPIVEQVKVNHEGSVVELIFTPDGQGLVSAWRSGSSRYWPVIEKKDDFVVVTQANEPIQSLAINLANGSIAYGLNEKKSENGKDTFEYKLVTTNFSKGIIPFQDLKEFEVSLDSPPDSLVFSNNQIISGSRSGSINIVDVSHTDGSITGKRKLFELPKRNGPNPFKSIERSDNGLLAVGIEDGLIYLLANKKYSTDLCVNDSTYDPCPFDVEGYNCTALKPKKNYGDVVGVGFWGNRIYGGYEDGTVGFWKCDTYSKKYKRDMVLKGHRDMVIDIALYPQNDVMISTDRHEVRVWDLKQLSQNQMASLDIKISDLAMSKEGDMIFAGEDEDGRGHIWSWNVAQKEQRRKLGSTQSALSSIDVSRDGLKLVTGAVDGAVVIWDVKTSAILKTHQNDKNISTVLYLSEKGRVYFGTGNKVMTWLPGSDPVLFHQSNNDFAVVTLALNEEETMLVAGFSDGTVKVWQKLDDNKSVTVGSHQGSAVAVSFYGSNKVVSTGDDGRVCLWDIALQQCENIYTFKEGAVAKSVDVNIGDEESKMIAFGGIDGSIRWTLASEDGKFRVFKVGQAESPVSDVRFSHDSRYVISVDEKGSIQKWPITEPDLLERLKNITNACLTIPQRIQYLQESEDVAKKNEESCKQEAKEKI